MGGILIETVPRVRANRVAAAGMLWKASPEKANTRELHAKDIATLMCGGIFSNFVFKKPNTNICSSPPQRYMGAISTGRKPAVSKSQRAKLT